ncbi:MAG: hypothetical protein ACI35O_03075 [Bacillaceae bacterium]
MTRLLISAITAIIFLMTIFIFTFFMDVKDYLLYAVVLFVSPFMIIVFTPIITLVYDLFAKKYTELMKERLRIPIFIVYGSVCSLFFFPLYFKLTGVSVWNNGKIIAICIVYGGLAMMIWIAIEKVLIFVEMKEKKILFNKIKEKLIRRKNDNDKENQIVTK